MKKLMDKFRKWLIRKLGGYTEQVNLPGRTIIEKRCELRPVAVRYASWISTSTWGQLKEEEIRREAARSLMHELVKPEYMEIKVKEDERTEQRMIRATVFVVRVEDALKMRGVISV